MVLDLDRDLRGCLWRACPGAGASCLNFSLSSAPFDLKGTHSAMPSNPPTPGGAPTHTTYEFAIPVRKANSPAQPSSDSPQLSKDPLQHSSKSSPQSSSKSSPQNSPQSSPQHSPKNGPKDSPKESRQHIEIPKITPLSGPSPSELARGLEGKFVDEFGNILDWDGTVLGRVDGDLPNGRKTCL